METHKARKVAGALLRLLKFAGMTDASVARRIGMSALTVKHWRTGAGRPTTAHIEILQELLWGGKHSSVEPSPRTSPRGRSDSDGPSEGSTSPGEVFLNARPGTPLKPSSGG